MDYPDDFPKHLQPPVDAALHDAEGEFLDAKKPSRYLASEVDQLLFKYVLKVFKAFAYQAALAQEQGYWSGERTRQALDEILDQIARYAHSNHHPHAGNQFSFGDFWKSATEWVKDSQGWRKIQDRLKEVAASRVLRAETAGLVLARREGRRGYRNEIHQWIEREGLKNVEQAARRLHLSKSALKSIMSSRGKPRYSQETLERVLKEIGYEYQG